LFTVTTFIVPDVVLWLFSHGLLLLLSPCRSSDGDIYSI
jgi:hypothetical protein